VYVLWQKDFSTHTNPSRHNKCESSRDCHHPAVSFHLLPMHIHKCEYFAHVLWQKDFSTQIHNKKKNLPQLLSFCRLIPSPAYTYIYVWINRWYTVTERLLHTTQFCRTSAYSYNMNQTVAYHKCTHICYDRTRCDRFCHNTSIHYDIISCLSYVYGVATSIFYRALLQKRRRI